MVKAWKWNSKIFDNCVHAIKCQLVSLVTMEEVSNYTCKIVKKVCMALMYTNKIWLQSLTWSLIFAHENDDCYTELKIIEAQGYSYTISRVSFRESKASQKMWELRWWKRVFVSELLESLREHFLECSIRFYIICRNVTECASWRKCFLQECMRLLSVFRYLKSEVLIVKFILC